MSALGQKQTLHQVRVMSALPPKADIRVAAMSALCQKRTSDSGSFAMFAAIRRDEEGPGRRSAAKLLSKGEVRCQIWFASYAPNRPQSGQWLSRRGLTI